MWKNCARGVDGNVIRSRNRADWLGARVTRFCGRRLRVSLRLTPIANDVEFRGSPFDRQSTGVDTVTVHRFDEIINGQRYAIEVMLVHKDRWRAYLVRVPGGPTALMPFYGATPQEAAEQLSHWLSLAHHAATNSV